MLRSSSGVSLGGEMRRDFCCRRLCRIASYLEKKNMAAPFARAVRASLSLDGAAQCACRRASRPRKVQVRCLSSTPAYLSGHSYANPHPAHSTPTNA
jgi:hypothetical protein